MERKGLSQWRLGFVAFIIALGATVLVGRLAYVQIVQHNDYRAQAQQMHTGTQEVVALRGTILDTNGYPLAMSEETYDVYIYRPVWADAKKVIDMATQMAAVLGIGAGDVIGQLNKDGPAEFPISRGLNYEVSRQVAALALPGVRIQPTSHRVFPEGNLAAPVLGFVGFDGEGLTGLERDFDEALSGKSGRLVYERDGLGNPIGMGSSSPAEPGSDLVLTIDRYIQRLAERELEAAVKEHDAKGGDIIVMDVKTGAILAMASRPSFDVAKPNLDNPADNASFRNRAITDLYEPGSVFKLITAAAALDQGLVTPDSTYEDTGVLAIGPWRIYNWDFSANGTTSVTMLLAKSLNTGAAWLSELLGGERFYDYVERFGFGEASGIELGGDAIGQMRLPGDPLWSEVDMATNSFGQGLTVTPLQMISAVAAIANDGMLMKPHIVKEVNGPKGSKVRQPEEVRQVISPATSKTMLAIMQRAVRAIPAVQISGFSVAGKTGTASISQGNGYAPDRFIASFAGVTPVSDPRLAILVKVDEPADVPWGTAVAAPAFGRIAEKALDYLRAPLEQAAPAGAE